jgi:hypothetical protein
MQRTYQLVKEGKVIMETQSASFDKAIDYFFEFYPDAYVDSNYTFKTVKLPHEL